jgi:hypothetical protein
MIWGRQRERTVNGHELRLTSASWDLLTPLLEVSSASMAICSSVRSDGGGSSLMCPMLPNCRNASW